MQACAKEQIRITLPAWNKRGMSLLALFPNAIILPFNRYCLSQNCAVVLWGQAQFPAWCYFSSGERLLLVCMGSAGNCTAADGWAVFCAVSWGDTSCFSDYSDYGDYWRANYETDYPEEYKYSRDQLVQDVEKTFEQVGEGKISYGALGLYFVMVGSCANVVKEEYRPALD